MTVPASLPSLRQSSFPATPSDAPGLLIVQIDGLASRRLQAAVDAGVPEVMEAIYYHGGVIRPVVGVIKALASALSAYGLPSSDPFNPTVIYHGSSNYRKIAMTFDDCWHPEVLQQLMDMLEPYPDFHFTFFAIGDAVEMSMTWPPV